MHSAGGGCVFVGRSNFSFKVVVSKLNQGSSFRVGFKTSALKDPDLRHS